MKLKIILLLRIIKSKKDSEHTNPKFLGASNSKGMILSKYAICGSKKSRFVKNQVLKT